MKLSYGDNMVIGQITHTLYRRLAIVALYSYLLEQWTSIMTSTRGASEVTQRRLRPWPGSLDQHVCWLADVLSLGLAGCFGACHETSCWVVYWIVVLTVDALDLVFTHRKLDRPLDHEEAVHMLVDVLAFKHLAEVKSLKPRVLWLQEEFVDLSRYAPYRFQILYLCKQSSRFHRLPTWG